MRFRATVWDTGNSRVLTIPSRLDIKAGDKLMVTLEGVDSEEKQTGQVD